jgi:hypothetical protein
MRYMTNELKSVEVGQTVCNERNERGKLCNGHLKQIRMREETGVNHLKGEDVTYQCQLCKTSYRGAPMGHLRDPFKQKRFIEKQLAAILKAAGGTLPVFRRSDRPVASTPKDEKERDAQ